MNLGHKHKTSYSLDSRSKSYSDMDSGRNCCLGFDAKKQTTELPLGWRFRPSPDELLSYYLIPKLKGEQLTTDYVRDLDVYKHDPDQLSLNETKYTRKNEGYFFVRNKGDNLRRTTPGGYWKIYEENVPLYGPHGEIGFKNKFKFYRGNDPDGTKTDWKMTEYRADFDLIPYAIMENYVVCKIKYKTKVEQTFVLPEGEEEEGGESSGDESGTDRGNKEK